MRRATPNPCIGSRLSAFRISMSSVPWMTSVVGESSLIRVRPGSDPGLTLSS